MDPIPLNVFLWVRCSIDIHKLCASSRQGYIATILASHISIVVVCSSKPTTYFQYSTRIETCFTRHIPTMENQPKHPFVIITLDRVEICIMLLDHVGKFQR
jgi:hypothetical protein